MNVHKTGSDGEVGDAGKSTGASLSTNGTFDTTLRSFKVYKCALVRSHYETTSTPTAASADVWSFRAYSIERVRFYTIKCVYANV